jgi:hypothetical protein
VTGRDAKSSDSKEGDRTANGALEPARLGPLRWDFFGMITCL